MKGNIIFVTIIIAFLFALVVVSSRAFLPDDMKAPAPLTETEKPPVK
ncbi:MAG: hypothetical protein WCA07_03810 [Gloeobacterales cyanobacterium]